MKMTMISHPRYSRLQICAMRPALHTCLLLAALCLLAPPARAATNDVTTALQRGLFEEEANQNLGAAIQAYQTVANQFVKDRKLAATAIFRLGECYRKQGNTNDAATQYQRILREFSDQPTLVTLSRQYLSSTGVARPVVADDSEKVAKLAQDLEKTQLDALELDRRMKGLASAAPEDMASFIDDDGLKEEIGGVVQALKKLTSLKATNNAQPEELAQAQKAVDALEARTEPRLEHYLNTLKTRQNVLAV